MTATHGMYFFSDDDGCDNWHFTDCSVYSDGNGFKLGASSQPVAHKPYRPNCPNCGAGHEEKHPFFCGWCLSPKF